MDSTITLIKPRTAPVAVGEDRGGGRADGLIPNVVEGITGKIDSTAFLARLKEAVDKGRAVVERLKDSVGEFEVDEITIGLAVSGEGSVGIATVGTEASIEVCFKRTKIRAYDQPVR